VLSHALSTYRVSCSHLSSRRACRNDNELA
jgi:hypothetical protein